MRPGDQDVFKVRVPGLRSDRRLGFNCSWFLLTSYAMQCMAIVTQRLMLRSKDIDKKLFKLSLKG